MRLANQQVRQQCKLLIIFNKSTFISISGSGVGGGWFTGPFARLTVYSNFGGLAVCVELVRVIMCLELKTAVCVGVSAVCRFAGCLSPLFPCCSAHCRPRSVHICFMKVLALILPISGS